LQPLLAVIPAELTELEGQFVHEDEPANSEYELAGQVVQAVAPDKLKLPAGQIVSVYTKLETACADADVGVMVGHL